MMDKSIALFAVFKDEEEDEEEEEESGNGDK